MRIFIIFIVATTLVVDLTAMGVQGKNGPTTVVFWHPFSGVTGEAFQGIIDNYNNTRGAEKNITVKAVYQGYEGTNKVILAYQTRDYENAPDINVGLTSTIPNMMEMEWTVSTENFLNDKNSEITKADFYKAMQRATTYQDEMVAIPFANSIPLLYYNTGIFEKMGYNSPPRDMDDLIEYVDRLKIIDNGKVIRYGLNMQIKRYQLIEFIVSQNTRSFFGNNEGGRSGPVTEITVGKDGTLKAFLVKLDKLLATGGYKYIEDDIKSEFAQGLHAMVIMSSSRLGTMDKLMQGQYMTAYLPKVNINDSSGAAIGGSCLSIFDRKDKRRMEAAWDFIEFLLTPENQYVFSTVSGYLPVNVGTEKLDKMKAFYEAHPQYKMALNQLKDTNPLAQEPMELVYGDVNKIITTTMLEFNIRKLTIDEAIEQIVSQINAALDEYHEANN